MTDEANIEKMTLRGISRSTITLSILAFSATMLVHAPLLRSGFDFHHNGLMLAAAIAVSEGKVVHDDFSFFYGPLTPWSQSLLFLLDSKSAVNLSIWAATLTAAIAAILAAFHRVLPPVMGISASGGIYAAGLWIALSPSFVLGTIQAWSSLLGAFLAVLGAFSGLKAMKSEKEGKRHYSLFWWLLSGTTVGLIPFARLNVGIALWLGMSLWLLILCRRKSSSKSDAALFAIGWVASTTAVLYSLLVTGGLLGYLNQSILGPAIWAREQATFFYFLEEVFDNWEGYLPRAIPLLIIGIAIERFWSVKLSPSLTRHFSRLLSSMLLFLSVFYAAGLQKFFNGVFWQKESIRDQKMSILLSPEELGSNVADLTLFLLAIFLIFFGFATLSFFHGWRSSKISLSEFQELPFFLIFAMALFTQFWPLGDIYHFWWGTPLLILSLVIAVTRFQKGMGLKIWVLPLVPLVFMQLASLGAQLEQRVNLGPTNTVLSQTYLDERSLDYVENLNSLFDSTVNNSEPILFFVNNGFETVLQGSFRSGNSTIVAWAPEIGGFDELKSWEGKSMIDFISIQKLGLNSFSELSKAYRLEIVGCSYSAEPFYNPVWDISDPYICVMQPKRM